MGIEVKLVESQMAFLRNFNKIAKRVEKTGISACENIASSLTFKLRANVRGGVNVQPPLSTLTLQRRRAGTPLIPRSSSSTPLFETGGLAHSIQFEETVKGSQWVIAPGLGGIAPSRPGGLRPDVALYMNEIGYTVSIPETYKMRQFLFMLFNGRPASSSGGTRKFAGNADRKTGKVYTIVVPPRPVVSRTLQSMRKQFHQAINSRFSRLVQSIGSGG